MMGFVNGENTAVKTLVNVAASSQVACSFTLTFGNIGRLVIACVHYSCNVHYTVQRSSTEK